MKYESLIFDIDGTLWDSTDLVAEGYNIQLKREGLDHLMVTGPQLKSLFGKIMTEIADVIFSSIPVPERYDLMERCMDTENKYLFENGCKIGYAGVLETIRELAKTYRLFIVSNSQCGYPELCIQKLDIAPFISAHMCFGDTGTSKGQTILRLMKEQNITSAAYVGDTQGDYEASVEAGIPFIWATYGFGEPERYDAKIDTFPQLLNL